MRATVEHCEEKGTVLTASRSYFLAGHAFFTVTSPSGKEYTYRIIHMPARDQFREAWMVWLVEDPSKPGSDFLGMTGTNGLFRTTARSCESDDSMAVRVLRRVLACTWSGHPEDVTESGWSIDAHGQCGQCSRALKTTEARERGLCPGCLKRLQWRDVPLSIEAEPESQSQTVDQPTEGEPVNTEPAKESPPAVEHVPVEPVADPQTETEQAVDVDDDVETMVIVIDEVDEDMEVIEWTRSSDPSAAFNAGQREANKLTRFGHKCSCIGVIEFQETVDYTEETGRFVERSGNVVPVGGSRRVNGEYPRGAYETRFVKGEHPQTFYKPVISPRVPREES